MYQHMIDNIYDKLVSSYLDGKRTSQPSILSYRRLVATLYTSAGEKGERR
jgi:hypothetical protein